MLDIHKDINNKSFYFMSVNFNLLTRRKLQQVTNCDCETSELRPSHYILKGYKLTEYMLNQRLRKMNK